MNGVKIKTDKHGICKEFTINDVSLGQGIIKLEIIIEPCKPTKLIMELNQEIDIECENAEIMKKLGQAIGKAIKEKA